MKTTIRRVFCALVWIEDVTVLADAKGEVRAHVGRHNDTRMLSFETQSGIVREFKSAIGQLATLPPSQPSSLNHQPQK